MTRASIVLVFLLLAACSRGAPASNEVNPSSAVAEASRGGDAQNAPASVAAPAPPADASGATAPAYGGAATSGAVQAQGAGMTPSTPMLAYTYSYQLQANADRARALMQRHQQACAAAGPALCQVVSANEQKNEDDQFIGALELRAAPVWLDRFRAGLDRDASAAGGRVIGATVQSEDLTRAIVDSDAALRARTTLRGRLENLLATRQGSLSDLLEVERELARVQGEIDATQSELAVMRTRVATSRVSLNYASRPIITNPGAFRPLGQALNDSAEMFYASLGVMVRIVVTLSPWAITLALVLWLLRKRLPKIGRRRPGSLTPPGPADGPPKPVSAAENPQSGES